MTRESDELKNCEVIITRAQHQQGALSAPLARRGAQMITAPVIQLAPPPPLYDRCYQDGSWMIPIQEVGVALRSFNWLIFTSANAVRLTHERWRDLGGLDGLHKIYGTHFPSIVCVGSATQRALIQVGIQSSVIPKAFHAEGVIELLSARSIDAQKVLIPRALVAREVLPEALRAQGAEVWVSPVYQTLPLSLSPQVRTHILAPCRGKIRYLIFTSDSTLRYFTDQFSAQELQTLHSHTRVIVIGPVVAQSATEMGYHVQRVAHPHTVGGLIDAIITDWREMIK